MMGDIYSSVSNILIWLGKNETDAESVDALLNTDVYDVIVGRNRNKTIDMDIPRNATVCKN